MLGYNIDREEKSASSDCPSVKVLDKALCNPNVFLGSSQYNISLLDNLKSLLPTSLPMEVISLCLWLKLQGIQRAISDRMRDGQILETVHSQQLYRGFQTTAPPAHSSKLSGAVADADEDWNYGLYY